MNIQAPYSVYTCQQRMSIISKPSNHVQTKNGAHLIDGLNLAHSTLWLFKYRLQPPCIKAYHNHSPHPTRSNPRTRLSIFNIQSYLFSVLLCCFFTGNGRELDVVEKPFNSIWGGFATPSWAVILGCI
eukprot:TRINITY_DN4924_c0_g1_i4.p1 TRINITY_DN4924_c0_g1~~TRINITY_DN4924_c0_g1_i4.p1  ORF type:complete len:128 (+),score=13.11 TRINITY_DN4924_c0_g1_i4:515-898(+)